MPGIIGLRRARGERRRRHFLDAAAGAKSAAEVHLVYDPFVPEDAAHARRIDGPNVRHLRVGHMGHRLVGVHHFAVTHGCTL